MEELNVAIDALKYINAGFVALSGLAVVGLWLLGIGPALWRLGNGLSRRKIALFAKGDAQESLRSLLHDSSLFRKGNICAITTEGDIGICERATLFLVHWPDWKDSIEDVLRLKGDRTALIVYAPHEGGPIPTEMMARLNRERNVIVTNFRGRLLNDLVVSMITTSYEKD